jgi:hypothetical protein
VENLARTMAIAIIRTEEVPNPSHLNEAVPKAALFPFLIHQESSSSLEYTVPQTIFIESSRHVRLALYPYSLTSEYMLHKMFLPLFSLFELEA